MRGRERRGESSVGGGIREKLQKVKRRRDGKQKHRSGRRKSRSIGKEIRRGKCELVGSNVLCLHCLSEHWAASRKEAVQAG